MPETVIQIAQEITRQSGLHWVAIMPAASGMSGVRRVRFKAYKDGIKVEIYIPLSDPNFSVQQRVQKALEDAGLNT